MKLYIAICQDRHEDTLVRVFDAPEKAIAYAKNFVSDRARVSKDIRESTCFGLLYQCTFSCEGDYVYVEESKLNQNEYEGEV